MNTTLPAEGCILNFSLTRNSHITTPLTAILICLIVVIQQPIPSPTHSNNAIQGNVTFSLIFNLINSDKLAYNVLPIPVPILVPVRAFTGPTWNKVCDIPSLAFSFPVHWSWYSAPCTVPWSQCTSLHKWADKEAFHLVVCYPCMTFWKKSLFFTSPLPLLKCNAQCLTVLTSTGFHKC